MNTFASAPMAMSAGIILLPGVSHLACTFSGAQAAPARSRTRSAHQSTFLLVVGALLAGGYVFPARRRWSSVPFRCIVVAAVAYLGALVAAML